MVHDLRGAFCRPAAGACQHRPPDRPPDRSAPRGVRCEDAGSHIDQGISQEIALARLCTVFAGLALVIACVGLYGTVAFNVSRRVVEIGVRMALGAQRAGIVWLILRSVLILELLGLAIGVPIVLLGSRYVESLLFGIKPNDPLVVSAGVAALLSAGLVASYMPARRASSVDPMVALRNE